MAEHQTGSGPKTLPLTGINLSLRVLLQGAYNPETALMNATLRERLLLPQVQPYGAAPFNYTGNEQMSTEVLSVNGQDAVVDWLLLELRHADNPSAIVAQQAVLLQRDGDVVNPQTGAVVVNFSTVPSGDYYIAIRHRNHMGVMTQSPYTLGTSLSLVDFSDPATAVRGNVARTTIGNFALLWAGEANQDGRLIAVGVGNDSNPLLIEVLTAPGNTNLSASYLMVGYLTVDYNLDGQATYTGPGNDNNILLFNILSHPLNTGYDMNFIVTGM